MAHSSSKGKGSNLDYLQSDLASPLDKTAFSKTDEILDTILNAANVAGDTRENRIRNFKLSLQSFPIYCGNFACKSETMKSTGVFNYLVVDIAGTNNAFYLCREMSCGGRGIFVPAKKSGNKPGPGLPNDYSYLCTDHFMQLRNK